jgi:hypothetical protein
MSTYGKAALEAVQRRLDKQKAAGYAKKLKPKGGPSGSSGTDKTPYKPKSMR